MAPWNCKYSGPVHTMPEKFKKDVNHSEDTSNVFCTHFVGEIWKCNIGFVFEEIVTSSFWKNSILKMFSINIKTQSRRFQIPRVWTVCSFEERPFSWQIVVDGRPKPRNKAAFSNISSVVWTRPQYSCLSSVTSQTWGAGAKILHWSVIR